VREARVCPDWKCGLAQRLQERREAMGLSNVHPGS
jgi:hypothetical protein